MTALDEPVARPAGSPEATVPPAEGPAVAAGRDTGGSGAATPFELADGHRWLLGALLAAAGVVHLVMAPQHLDLGVVEGVGFFVAGWVQLACAAACITRPGRALLQFVVLSNLAFVAVWVVSRTAGLPFGDHAGQAESVGVVDGATVAFELVAVAVAALVLAGKRPPLPAAGVLAAVAPLAVLMLATGAIASPSARDHASGAHGEHVAGDAHAAGDAHGHGDAGAPADDKGFSLLSNGHQHGAGELVDLDAGTQAELDEQLALTDTLIEDYPTVADAEAAGYWRAGPFVPGLGTHYVPPGNPMANTDGTVEAEDMDTAVLIYDGLAQGSPLAGFMFMSGGEEEPDGFVGPNDYWHYHEYVCIVPRADGSGVDTPFGADSADVTQEMCDGVEGQYIRNTGYMTHVWTVPGYETENVFADLNAEVACPDGTYYQLPTEQWGTTDNACASES